MKRLPRILPLTAIAVGGVLGVKVLADAQAVPQALSGAKAWAEEAAAKVSKSSAKAPPEKADAPADAAKTAAAAAAKPTPVAVCAPSPAELAKSAGLSPAELQVLQSLGTRRGQLDQREEAMDTQMALLAAAETKLDAKIKSLNGLKAEMQGLLGQVDKKQDEENQRLVSVYEKMKPKDAAVLMAALDDKVRIPVAAKMKDKSLAAVLSAMPTAEGKHITEALAQRYAAVQAAAAAMNAPPSAAPAPAANAAADPKASPGKAADAGATTDPAAAKAAPAKPRAVAKAKPRTKARPKVAKAAEPPLSGREYPKPTATPPSAAPAAPPAATPQA